LSNNKYLRLRIITGFGYLFLPLGMIKRIGFTILVLLFLIPIGIFSQSYTSYFTGNSSDTLTNPSGGICLMGGATEDDEAMKWFLSRCAGGDVLVLRASGADGYNDYMYNQLGIQVNSVETIVCNNKSASFDPYIQQKIRQAEAIWLAGGDQWDYVSFWRNTAIDSLINVGISLRHLVIGGTSAGMAVIGGFYFSAENGTVTSSQALLNPYNSRMAIDSSGFLKNQYMENVICDTHYNNPDRKGRHVTFLARILKDWGIEARGIGCNEYSALCIDTSGLAHCFGDYPRRNDFIYFLQTNCENTNKIPENCFPGYPLEWKHNNNAIKVYKVPGKPTGDNFFNLADWKTGNGGMWEDWYASSGGLFQLPGEPIGCSQPSAIRAETQSKEFLVYPNPIDGGSLFLNLPVNEINQVSIVNISGRVVSVIPGYKIPQNQLIIKDLPTGIYLIWVETKGSGFQSGIIVK
jgi:cyanophycinase-like exopeptidase